MYNVCVESQYRSVLQLQRNILNVFYAIFNKVV